MECVSGQVWNQPSASIALRVSSCQEDLTQEGTQRRLLPYELSSAGSRAGRFWSRRIMSCPSALGCCLGPARPSPAEQHLLHSCTAGSHTLHSRHPAHLVLVVSREQGVALHQHLAARRVACGSAEQQCGSLAWLNTSAACLRYAVLNTAGFYAYGAPRTGAPDPIMMQLSQSTVVSSNLHDGFHIALPRGP